MAYVLEIITSADQEKIIADAKRDPVKERDLVYAAKNPRDFPKNWAIDRERNFYMYLAPILMRPETMGTSLFFSFKVFSMKFAWRALLVVR